MRQCNRRHGVHHRQLCTTISRLQGVLDTGGRRRVGLSTSSKRRVLGRCKDRRWCRCGVSHLPRKIGSLFSVSASEWYDQSKLAHGPVNPLTRRLPHLVFHRKSFNASYWIHDWLYCKMLGIILYRFKFPTNSYYMIQSWHLVYCKTWPTSQGNAGSGPLTISLKS